MTEKLLTDPVVTGEVRRRMTYEQYLSLPEEGPLVEWVDEEVIFHMPPLEVHQRIVTYLNQLLSTFAGFFGLGRVYVAPFEMKCWTEKTSREPDLLFVATANLGRLSQKRLEGPADLIAEVVSDDSVSRDYDVKFIEYQECGVQEYWIVDPRPRRRRALFYQRGEDGLFEAVNPQGGVYPSRTLPGFWMKVNWLWEMPDALLAFAEIAGFSEQVMEELRERKAAGGP
ncbi:MAG: Uma2 family endonuclease [Chloroflexi bacterium]|nr:Uma2 family endonuclease [Chloroflexota bacterium]